MQNVVINGGKTNLIKLGTIIPMNFEGYLIFSLSKEWINKFQGIPKFIVCINKHGKLCITSHDKLKNKTK